MRISKNQNTVIVYSLRYITLLILIIIFSVNCQAQTQIKKGNLKVVVHNIKSKTGQVGFFLFNSADAFPSHTEKALLSGFVKVVGSTAEYTFTNLTPGSYAVYVFHDEDSDKNLKTNFIGMPKEGMGVSNDAKGHFGPPKYDDAKFDLNKSDQTITISLTYL